MSKREEAFLGHDERLKIVEMDRDQTNIRMDSLLKTLQVERTEREAFELEAQE